MTFTSFADEAKQPRDLRVVSSSLTTVSIHSALGKLLTTNLHPLDQGVNGTWPSTVSYLASKE